MHSPVYIPNYGVRVDKNHIKREQIWSHCWQVNQIAQRRVQDCQTHLTFLLARRGQTQSFTWKGWAEHFQIKVLGWARPNGKAKLMEIGLPRSPAWQPSSASNQWMGRKWRGLGVAQTKTIQDDVRTSSETVTNWFQSIFFPSFLGSVCFIYWS